MIVHLTKKEKIQPHFILSARLTNQTITQIKSASKQKANTILFCLTYQISIKSNEIEPTTYQGTAAANLERLRFNKPVLNINMQYLTRVTKMKYKIKQ